MRHLPLLLFLSFFSCKDEVATSEAIETASLLYVMIEVDPATDATILQGEMEKVNEAYFSDLRLRISNIKVPEGNQPADRLVIRRFTTSAEAQRYLNQLEKAPLAGIQNARALSQQAYRDYLKSFRS